MRILRIAMYWIFDPQLHSMHHVLDILSSVS